MYFIWCTRCKEKYEEVRAPDKELWKQLHKVFTNIARSEYHIAKKEDSIFHALASEGARETREFENNRPLAKWRHRWCPLLEKEVRRWCPFAVRHLSS